jgi:calmodulin
VCCNSAEFILVDAFVACGGQADKEGHVSRETLVRIIKHDFGLTIDIEELIDRIDADGSGEIEYEEFKTLLS